VTLPSVAIRRQPGEDAVLIARVLAGEREVFHELIRPYERQLYLTAFSLLKNDAEAEDTVQEAVLKAYRGLASFRGDAKFSTWIITITLNESRQRLRRDKRAPTDSLDEQMEEEGDYTPAILTDWREVPLEALERGEIRALLQDAIDALPEKYREIFVLRDMEELDVSEAAQVLGISISLVKVRLHRARMMLQKKLAPALQAEVRPQQRGRLFRRLPW
jgi:RNA polymerase sigma-70 factor (ECF subfamily)